MFKEMKTIKIMIIRVVLKIDKGPLDNVNSNRIILKLKIITIRIILKYHADLAEAESEVLDECDQKSRIC